MMVMDIHHRELHFVHHTNSLVFPLSYHINYHGDYTHSFSCTQWATQLSIISLHLILASLPLRFKYTDDIHRQQLLVEDEKKNFHQFCWGGTAGNEGDAVLNGTDRLCHLCI